MALSLHDPLVWGVVFVVVFVVEILIVLNIKRGSKSRTYERPSREAVLAEGETLTDVLSRFVETRDGTRIGETVGMDGDLVIVKETGKTAYLAVPRATLERHGDHFRITETLDPDAARRLGSAWQERQHRVVEYRPEELPEDERDRPY